MSDSERDQNDLFAMALGRAAPDEKLTGLLARMAASLKADAIMETLIECAMACRAVRNALARKHEMR